MTPPQPAQRSQFVVAVAAITLFGGLLRAVFAARQPLWRDEAFTALALQHPTQPMLDIVGRDSAPPLAYLLNHLVTTYVSTSPAALRLVSIVAGTMVIPIGAALGRRVGGDRGGVWAAVACATLPALVLSSRDARMYALSGAFVIAAVLALWRFLETPSAHRLLLYALLCAAALQTEYFAVFAFAAMFVGVCVAYRPPLRLVLAVAGANLVAAATLTAWLLRARAQFDHAQLPFWVEPLGPKTVAGTLVQFFSGPPIDPGTPLKIVLQTCQGVAIALGAAALIVLTLRRHSLSVDQRFAALYLAIAGTGGTLILALLSVWRPLLEARYASVGWAPVVVLLGVGASMVHRALLRRAAAAVMTLMTVALSVAITHPDSATVAAYLSAHGNGGLVEAAPSEYLLLLDYGDPGLVARMHIVATDVPWFWGTAAYPPDAVLPTIPAATLAQRLPILSADATEDPAPAPPPGYRPADRWCVTGTCVTTFVAQ